MTVLALVLYAAYLLVGFGLRTLIQVRRTGDTGFRGLSGRPGTAAWWGAVLFLLAIVLGIGAPIAALAGLPTITLLDHTAVNAAGVVLAALGIALTLIAQLAMGAQWRIGVDESERTELVTGGVFAVVRNPIFTAMGLTGLGLSLVVPNVVAVLGLAAMITAVQLQVRVVEEPYLRRRHGPVYADYQARVGRFLPGVGTRPRP